MIKIDKFNTLNDMTEEQKDKYINLVHKNCKSVIIKFFQSNKDYIKEQLSRTGGKMFEDEVLQQRRLKQEFLKQLISKLDDERAEKLNIKILKAIFKEDKELVKSIVDNKEIDKDKLITFILKDDDDKELIKGILECLGIETNITEENLKEVADKAELESLRNQLKNKDDEISVLQQRCQSDKDEYEKKLSEQESFSSKKIEEKDREIDELKNRIKELESVNVKVVNIEPEKVSEVVNEEQNNTIEVVKEEKLQVDFDTAICDLEERTLLGVVKSEGIKPDKSWIIITPIVPIISENSNINREEFTSKVDYRSDYSTFILFIDQDLLRMCLSPADANNYQYYTNDEKFGCLFEAFCKKIIFFRPEFPIKENEKRKLNAVLVAKPIDYEDFNNSTFVPSMSLSKKDFESRVSKHDDLILENYPSSLSSNLKYVYVKDSIYEINYVPSSTLVNGKYIRWKYNGNDEKVVLKKLDIKITNEANNKYIITPGAFKNFSDSLYVKNITLIQHSNNSNTVFDEDEFITKVGENAKSKNLFYTEEDLKNFHVAVKSSNLVILAGPSGIGKTKLPMVYANTLGLDVARNTVLFVPISPSYLEPEDVLGYIRPISSKDGDSFNAEYMESQTGLVNFLLDASEHKDKIHIVIFDEMNLSQIEHWFAPFISLLEQEPDSRVLNLYSNNLKVKNGEKYPSSINVGENVFFVGTVNIDETTKQISDRLLDRAIVINLAAPSFTSLKEMESVKSEISQEISYSRFSTAVAKVDNAALAFNDKEFALINDLNGLLTESIYNKSISFRSLTKMAIYLKNASGILSRNEAIDFVISQIVVKKINGSREELEGILSDDDTQGILKVLNDYSSVSEFTKTRKLIEQKIQELSKYGFTR